MIGYKFLHDHAGWFKKSEGLKNLRFCELQIPDDAQIKESDIRDAYIAQKVIPIRIWDYDCNKYQDAWSAYSSPFFSVHYEVNKEIDDTENFNSYDQGGIYFYGSELTLLKWLDQYKRDYGWE